MRGLPLLAAFACAVALTLPVMAAADDVDVSVVIPSSSAGGARKVSDAVLSWAVNPEAGSGAYFGGCNFLSAGRGADSGSARLWKEGDGLYRAHEANVTIEKPLPGNAWKVATFADRCLDERGTVPRPVTPATNDYGTGNRFVITGGTGTADPTGQSAEIRWKGSVTLVAYGGLSYSWFSDPVLKISGGRGTLTATGGGYSSSREDVRLWEPLAERTITLAELSSPQLGELGFSATPAYRGVETEGAGNADQSREGVDWGAFPKSFIDFQTEVGQAAYWFSTGSIRDFAKPPYPVGVSWSAADRVDTVVPVDPPRPGTSAPPVVRPTSLPSASPSPSPSTRRATAATGPISAKAASPAVSVTPGSAAADSHPATTPDALMASARGLIPAAVAALEDPRAQLVTAASSVVALAAFAFLGFRRGWLALPWSRKSVSDQG